MDTRLVSRLRKVYNGRTKMKIRLAHPQYANIFWSFRYALRFVSKQAGFQPGRKGMTSFDWKAE
ncbi:MAG TPA: hypothetical protein DCR97_06920 [Deltaproteobacteria bacterium]|nr:hypothetical protein [Deltaproteobacteria bacterium]